VIAKGNNLYKMFTITAEICDPVSNSLVEDHLLQTKEAGERAYMKYEDEDEENTVSVSPVSSEMALPELDSKRSRSYSRTRTASPNMLKVPSVEERVRTRSRSRTLVKRKPNKHNRDESIPEHFKLTVHNYLVDLYTQHGASKKECSRVPGLMEKYQNREQQLLRKVMRHYKVLERKLEVPATILEILCE